MITLTNAFGGLSAADIPKLFGAKSSAESASSATSASSPNATPSDRPKTIVSSEAKSIRALIVQAQVETASLATQLGGSAVHATVEAAYAAEISDGSTTQTLEGQASTYADQSGGTAFVTNSSFTSTSSASGSADDATANPQAGWTDDFELGVAFGSLSLSVGFGEAGLGQVKVERGLGLVVGQGTVAEHFQLTMGNDTGCAGIAINVMGLDDAQAKTLADAFHKAVSALGMGAVKDAGYVFTASESMLRYAPAPGTP